MKKFLRVTSFLFVSIWLSDAVNAAEPSKETIEFFENRVRPLLVSKCQSCHGVEKQQASLRLDSKMGVLSGGESGAAVIAGRVDDSLLIQAVRRDGLEMPPDEPLDSDEVAILEKWVRDGAYWPTEDPSTVAAALGDQIAIKAKADSHWSFRPIVAPAVPSASNADSAGATNPIDAFIDAKQKEVDIAPLEQADRRTLIRRVSYDITGLPPTFAEIEAFVNDADPLAYEKLVDRLLASKEFGQRWGRYWLDIARYADTRDWMAQTDERYPFAYTYRDYVIRSINQDKPYDDFIREQIAADLIHQSASAPELAALGFLTVGPRFRNNSIEQIADRIDCISRGLMGLTIACARCHDHKYDPVTIEDYYALHGVFDSTELTEELPVVGSARKISAEQQAGYEAERAAKVKAREDFIDDLRLKAIDLILENPDGYFRAAYDMGVADKLDIRGAITKHKVKETALNALVDVITDAMRVKSNVDHPVIGPLARGLSLKDKDFASEWNSWISSTDEANFRASLMTHLRDTKITSKLELMLAYAGWIAKANETDASKAGSDREALLASKSLLDLNRDSVIVGFRLLGGGRKQMGDLESAIREVDAVHPGSPPRAMVLLEKEKPITPFVFLRGEPGRRGDRVPRRFISYLENGSPKAFSEQSSGRLELANKIVDPSNPLTARVAVNRVWMKYFDVGFAESPDDFGLRSAPPKHQDLLDWLAANFMDHEWSMKWLHRTILTSNAYKRASVIPEGNVATTKDSENQYYWRQNRKRLDFEATRDTMLAVGGELDRSLEGQSIKLSATPYPKRRTVYAYVDRVDMDPMLRVFDFASPLASTASRAETIIPQHALFVMNHPFVIERAQTIANKVRPPESKDDLVARGINAMYRRMLGRNPTVAERALALSFIETPVSTEGLKRSSPWSYGILVTEDDGKERFEPLPHWTGQFYQGGTEFPDAKFGHARITDTGGHPGKQSPCVRRFAVPADGIVKIDGLIKHARDNSDGVTARIVHRDQSGSAKQIGEAWPVCRSEANTSVDPIEVKVGDFIDFVVESGKTGSADSFNWTVDIEIDFDGQSTSTWSSKEGFSSPPPALMDGWEQLAQALMLTNEFMYVD